MNDKSICNRPDRDVPGLICGYPLPCPWHTVTIDTTSDPAVLSVPCTSTPAHDPELLDTLKDIGRAIQEENEKAGKQAN